MKTVTAKFGPMRKPQEFVVYPRKQGVKTMTVQSDRCIGQFDPDTRMGFVNFKRSNPIFIDLHPMRGATAFEFPADFVAQCLDVQPKSGDLIGAHPVTGPVYVA